MKRSFTFSCFSWIAFAVLLPAFVLAKVKLPSIISDNMVLQQNTSVKLWGYSDAGREVVITTSWSSKSYRAQINKRGEWATLIKTPVAGGPFHIIFDDGSQLKVQNIMVGEVWFCSGQSNMERSMAGAINQPILNSNLILSQAKNTNLRLYKVGKIASDSPLTDTKGSWAVSDSKAAYNFSAVGFQFGQMLQQALDIPIGIIEADWGGSPIESFMDAESLKDFPEINTSNPLYKESKKSKDLPSYIFNGMINPLTQFSIRGSLWYQGEWNRRNASVYKQLMISMVKEWRKKWGIGDFPFYFVQIAPYDYRDAARDSVPFVREAQMLAVKGIPNSGMVVSMDVGEKDVIHPADKTTIAQRLLFWALGHTYKWEGISYKSPEYKSMEIEEDAIKISFFDTPKGLTSYNQDITGFELCGSDGIFYPADAMIQKDETILLKSKAVKRPLAARYLFTPWARGNLYNIAGLPVAPFQTNQIQAN